MPTLLHDTEPAVGASPAPAVPAVEHAPSEAAALRQALRAYTDQIERLLSSADEERWALRAQVAHLTTEVSALREELAGMRASLPMAESSASLPLVTEPVVPASALSEPARAIDTPVGCERVQPATVPAAVAPEERTIPPGGDGVMLVLRPPQRPPHIERLCRALELQPAIERAVFAASTAELTRLRLRLRTPGNVSTVRSALEQALGVTLDPGAVRDTGDDVDVRLRARM